MMKDDESLYWHYVMDAGTAKQQNHLIMSSAESLPGTHFVIYSLIFWCCQTAEKKNANPVPHNA